MIFDKMLAAIIKMSTWLWVHVTFDGTKGIWQWPTELLTALNGYTATVGWFLRTVSDQFAALCVAILIWTAFVSFTFWLTYFGWKFIIRPIRLFFKR